MIKMPIVLSKAQQNLGSVDEIKELQDPVTWIKSRLTVSRIRGSELYTIGFNHRDPKQAQLVVKEIVDAYLKFSRDYEETQTTDVIRLLDKEGQEQEKKIAVLREELRQKESELTAKDPYAPSTGRPRVARVPAGVLMEKLTNIEVEEKIAQIELEVLKKTTEPVPVPAELPREFVERIESYPEVERLRWLTISRRLQLADLGAESVSEADASTNQRLQQKIENAEEALIEVRQQLAEELSQAAVAEAQREREGQLRELQKRLELLAANREQLQRKLEEERERMQVTGGDSMELEFQRAALERERQTYRLISARRMSLLTELNAPSHVSLIEPASLPTEPVEGPPLWSTFFAGLAGLLLPFGSVAVGGLIRYNYRDAA
jgi:uncharacterized protein involved in exopolysaccharide biosynthesis